MLLLQVQKKQLLLPLSDVVEVYTWLPKKMIEILQL